MGFALQLYIPKQQFIDLVDFVVCADAEYVGIAKSLLVTYRLHHVDPYEYFVDVLQRVKDHPPLQMAEFKPWRWKQLFANITCKCDAFLMTFCSAIDRINHEVVRILPMADVKDKLAGDGSEFGKNTPEQAAAFVRSEIEQWSAAVRASGATAQ